MTRRIVLLLGLVLGLGGASHLQAASLQAASAAAAENIRSFVSISGRAYGAEGREIRLRRKTDPISGKDSVLSEGKIDENGNFSLSFISREIEQISIEIDYYSCDLFVFPSTNYFLEFFDNDYDLDSKINVFLPTETLPELRYKILLPRDEILNTEISRFNTLYNTYMDYDTYMDVVINGDRTRIKEFLFLVDSLFANCEMQYVKDYILYKIATLEEFAGLKTREVLYKNYLEDKPILYTNPSFVDFVASFFDSYFETKTPIRYSTLEKLFYKSSISGLIDTLGADPMLRNFSLREYVFCLASMQALGGKSSIAKNTILKRLKEFSAIARTKKNAEIARNILSESELNVFNFSLLSLDFLEVNLDKTVKNYQKKDANVYLSFLKTASQASGLAFKETNLLIEYLNQNPTANKTHVIIIGLDDRFEDFAKKTKNMLSKLEENSIHSIDFLWFAKKPSKIRKMGVNGTPAFILINKKKKIEGQSAIPSQGGIDSLNSAR